MAKKANCCYTSGCIFNICIIMTGPNVKNGYTVKVRLNFGRRLTLVDPGIGLCSPGSNDPSSGAPGQS